MTARIATILALLPLTAALAAPERTAEEILEAARAEIETETNRAKDALRAQVAVLAVEGAERILEKSVDADAHSALLDKLASEL